MQLTLSALLLTSIFTTSVTGSKESTSPPSECLLPKDFGGCTAFLRRFYYNEQTQRCERFIFGGCGGNKNNFIAVKDCRDYCLRQKKLVQQMERFG